MVIPSVFELNSIKDQLSLLKAITSHIDWEKYNEEYGAEHLEDYKALVNKMNTIIKNLKDKQEELEDSLDQ